MLSNAGISPMYLSKICPSSLRGAVNHFDFLNMLAGVGGLVGISMHESHPCTLPRCAPLFSE
jgi:hypothetical protein